MYFIFLLRQNNFSRKLVMAPKTMNGQFQNLRCDQKIKSNLFNIHVLKKINMHVFIDNFDNL